MNKPQRSLWPISIVTFFVIAITFFAGFIAWAVRQREDLVAADYYEHEIRYQARLDSLNRSQALAAKTVVTFEPAAQAIVITLPEAQVPGATGSIHLYRPSDARLDREVPLALATNGIQRIATQPLAAGLWKVRIKWSANGQDYFLDQPVIVTGG